MLVLLGHSSTAAARVGFNRRTTVEAAGQKWRDHDEGQHIRMQEP